jgi:hypothetical protein
MPPVLAAKVRGPEMVLGEHAMSGSSPPSPMSTKPDVVETLTGPVMVLPQIRMAAAPSALRGPVMAELAMANEAPRWTVTGPVMWAPVISVGVAMLRGPLLGLEMVLAVVTFCVPGAEELALKL